jgi:branched-chain amino acid transport system permease protein
MFFQIFFSGIAIGCIYGLIALGIVLIYKATDVANFAHGELMMLGAFIAYTLIVGWSLAPWLSFLVTFIFMGLFGAFLERVFIRIVTGENILSIIMVTLGLSLVIRTVCGMIWSHESKQFPVFYSEKVIKLGDIVIAPINLWIIVSIITLALILYIMFKFTKVGVAMRATSLNQFASCLMGINVGNIFSFTWVIASVIAALAGILVAPVVFLNTNMGHLGLKAFPAAILGGFGSVPGAIIGGLIIGVAENFAGLYLPEGSKSIFAYIILILVLMFRPEGIFGKHEQKKV